MQKVPLKRGNFTLRILRFQHSFMAVYVTRATESSVTFFSKTKSWITNEPHACERWPADKPHHNLVGVYTGAFSSFWLSPASFPNQQLYFPEHDLSNCTATRSTWKTNTIWPRLFYFRRSFTHFTHTFLNLSCLQLTKPMTLPSDVTSSVLQQLCRTMPSRNLQLNGRNST